MSSYEEFDLTKPLNEELDLTKPLSTGHESETAEPSEEAKRISTEHLKRVTKEQVSRAIEISMNRNSGMREMKHIGDALVKMGLTELILRNMLISQNPFIDDGIIESINSEIISAIPPGEELSPEKKSALAEKITQIIKNAPDKNL